MSITPSVQFRKDSALLEWWRTQSGVAEVGTIRLQAVVKGGSVRRFYRIQVDGESRGILMEYSPEKEENHVFAEVARFLSCLGVPVPEIFVHDPQNHLMWLEDLGDCDLESYCARNHHDRMAVYRKVMRSRIAFASRARGSERKYLRSHCTALSLRPKRSYASPRPRNAGA